MTEGLGQGLVALSASGQLRMKRPIVRVSKTHLHKDGQREKIDDAWMTCASDPGTNGC
jgi:hypothetical protein